MRRYIGLLGAVIRPVLLILRGKPFTGSGPKCLQLVRTAAGWRITGITWSDDDGE